MEQKLPIIVVEHLDDRIYKWNFLEYEQCSKYVPHDQLWFTNVPTGRIEQFGKCFPQRASKLVDPKRTIILDPKSTIELSADDLNTFDYFVVGGIMGDKDFNGRTGLELTQTIPGATLRHLGPKQFTTDNAVFVVIRILSGTPLAQIPFVDSAEIEFGETESVMLPYRYPVVKDRPLMNPKLIEHLEKSHRF